MDYSGMRYLLDFLLVGGDEAISPVFHPLRGAVKTVIGHHSLNSEKKGDSGCHTLCDLQIRMGNELKEDQDWKRGGDL